MRVVSLLAKGKSGKTSKSLKILWKLLQALKTKGCTAEFKNGLFHFLSMQRYGRRNFQKQIPPWKNDCLTHKSPEIESWMIRSPGKNDT